MDLGHFARDLFQDLAPPFLAHGDRLHGGDEFGAAGAAGVEDAEVGGLSGAEAKEHRLRFFAVAGLEGRVRRLATGGPRGRGFRGEGYHVCRSIRLLWKEEAGEELDGRICSQVFGIVKKLAARKVKLIDIPLLTAVQGYYSPRLGLLGPKLRLGD